MNDFVCVLALYTAVLGLMKGILWTVLRIFFHLVLTDYNIVWFLFCAVKKNFPVMSPVKIIEKGFCDHSVFYNTLPLFSKYFVIIELRSEVAENILLISSRHNSLFFSLIGVN